MASTRREEARPKGLARQDSSFIGTIKNFVSSPLNWFAGNEDATGKRRRAEPVIADDELSRRSKRMRITSPPEPTPAPVAPPLRRSSVVPRASSVVLPSSRATLSPRRTQRTMSIDPPRRDISHNDVDMIIDNPPSPRLPFRMRSSLTPQPPQIQTRYNTEPPPLNSLISNPVFLHQPTQPRETSTPPATTLGSLVETVRAVSLRVSSFFTFQYFFSRRVRLLDNSIVFFLYLMLSSSLLITKTKMVCIYSTSYSSPYAL